MAYPKGWPKCAELKCGKKAAVIIADSRVKEGRVPWCAEHAPKNGAKKEGSS
jgi:hypothetical protein